MKEPMQPQEGLQQRIRSLREDSDLTQKTVADILNITQSTYSDYENGRIHPPIDVLFRLADHYQVNLDYLTGRTDKKDMLPASKHSR